MIVLNMKFAVTVPETLTTDCLSRVFRYALASHYLTHVLRHHLRHVLVSTTS